MPLFAFRCSACSHEFEKLQRRSADAPVCPECSGSTTKIFQMTKARVKSAPKAPKASGTPKAATHAPASAAPAARSGLSWLDPYGTASSGTRTPGRPTPPPDVGPHWEGAGCYVAVGVYLPSLTFADDELDPFVEAVHAINVEYGTRFCLYGAWASGRRRATNWRELSEEDQARIGTGLVLGEVVIWCGERACVEVKVSKVEAARARLLGASGALAAIAEAAPERARGLFASPGVEVLLGTNDGNSAFAKLAYGEWLDSVDSDGQEEIYQKKLPIEMIRAGQHWDDLAHIHGLTVAKIPFYPKGRASMGTSQGEAAAVVDLGEAFEQLEQRVHAHTNWARLFLTEVTWYEH